MRMKIFVDNFEGRILGIDAGLDGIAQRGSRRIQAAD